MRSCPTLALVGILDTNFHQFTRIRGERGEWSLVALLCVLHSTGSENPALAKSFFLMRQFIGLRQFVLISAIRVRQFPAVAWFALAGCISNVTVRR